MNTKMLREQAHKDKKALKSNAKEKAKELKELAANAVDKVTDVNEAVTQKAVEAKASIVQAAHTMKAETKADIKKVGQINEEIAAGVNEAVRDTKHAGHDAVEKIKHL